MVASSIELLDKFSISKDVRNGKTFTDITQLLFSKSQKLKHDTIIKNPTFSLFEGTHALEVLNDKLDSGIIPLTDAQIEFDVTKGRPLNEVSWLCDSILRSTFVWLNNSTLAQTLLSNRFVEELLVNYSKRPYDGISACVFDLDHVEVGDELEEKLVHLVLKSVILGCLFFARVTCTYVHSGVVYEEEDINTQVMGLNLLSTIQLDEVLTELGKSIEFLKENYSKEKDGSVIANIISVLHSLLTLPLFLSTRIPVKSENINYDLSFLDTALDSIEYLKYNLSYLNSLTPIDGCYSSGIQKRLDNISPPRALESYISEDYTSLELLFNDFKQIFTIKDRETPQDIISHGLNFANTEHHPVARAFYPLFLVRDDRTVLGDQPLHEFLIETLNQFSCLNSEIFQTENHLAKHKIDEFMKNLTIQFFDSLSVTNQNPCRQRQHLSRLIIQFDSLQALAENLEVTLSDVFQIKDELKEVSNGIDEKVSLAIPLTSWVYYYKLEIMISVILRGFQLDIYKIWEFHSMYWYAVYLIDNLISLLERVKSYNNYKIEIIKNMKNKLKKKKGEQKTKYKEKYEFKVANDIPKLHEINNIIQLKIKTNKILKNLCELELINLSALSKAGIIKTPEFPSFVKDNKKTGNHGNLEMLYSLRMKPFSTVGVPHFPNYDHYVANKKKEELSIPSEEHIKELRSAILTDSKQIINAIESLDSSKITQDQTDPTPEELLKSAASEFSLNKDQWVSWFKQYQKSCIGITLNHHNNSAKVDNTSARVVVETEGYHRYFPIVKVVAK